MARKIKHISRERVEDSQRRLEEKLKGDPLGSKFLEELAMIEKEYRVKMKKGGRNESE